MAKLGFVVYLHFLSHPHIVSLPMFPVVQVIVLGAKKQSSCLNFTFMTSYTEHFRVLETPLLESQVRIMKKSQSCWMHSKKRKRGISSILHFFLCLKLKLKQAPFSEKQM